MKIPLPQIMELQKMEKAQLAQLCEALFLLLQEQNRVVVQTAPAPLPFSLYPPPYVGPVYTPGIVPNTGTPPYPLGGITFCNAADSAASTSEVKSSA